MDSIGNLHDVQPVSSAPAGATLPEPSTAVLPGSVTPPPLATRVLRVGVDLGTNTTVVEGSVNGERVHFEPGLVRTVVGHPKAGIIPGILPSDAEVLFGDEAIEYRLHLDLTWPLKDGFIDDIDVAKEFTQHLRRIVDPGRDTELWGVVGAPANAAVARQADIRAAMRGFLDRLLIVPEPFLAAMGLREDPGFHESGGRSDPTRHSLIVDIGAGTTDLCLVLGYFPTADDQVSFAKAGNFVDDAVFDGIQKRDPDLNLTRVTVTNIKEKHSHVSGFERDANVKVYVEGRPRTIDFGDIIRGACDLLVPEIVRGIKHLLKRCDSDSVVNVMQNIIVTGGGSQIGGLPQKIERLLQNDGYDCARTILPADYKRLVAKGALRIAENVREDQWQMAM
jgi:rod shape-determining protein MreB